MYALHLFSRLCFDTASVTNWMGNQVLMYGCKVGVEKYVRQTILYELTLHGFPFNRFAYWWRACAIYEFGQGQGQGLSLWLWKYVLLCFLLINDYNEKGWMTSSRDDKGFHGYNACSPTNVPRSQDLSPPSLCYHFGREQGNDTYFSMIVTALKMKIWITMACHTEPSIASEVINGKEGTIFRVAKKVQL